MQGHHKGESMRQHRQREEDAETSFSGLPLADAIGAVTALLGVFLNPQVVIGLSFFRQRVDPT